MSSILFSSSYGFKSSHKDLLDHMSFVGEATRIDVVLARCKLSHIRYPGAAKFMLLRLLHQRTIFSLFRIFPLKQCM
ncbi:uncharacterized protein LOC131644509 isoform X4 [Vicia villosa]|uniref:uncharacterized protein LOC131644509 isoform X4 n=1 Tax=Vicia villosa TaxID=3911 RepID=UPI00273BA84C|nr:uncharacterized protein LOC131644509 isoform X4 [Vicia villosa]